MSMTRQDIERRLVVERYLQGKLTPSEEAAFEETYLGDPDLVDQIELAERLREGLGELALAGELPRSRPRRRLAFLASAPYAAAASVLLAASLLLSTVLYVQNAELRARASGEIPAFRIEPLFATRGDGHVIARPDEGEWIMLMVDPGASDYETYRVTVRPSQPAAAPLVQTSGIEPGYEETLAVGVPGARLVPGDYEVIVEGDADGEWRPVTRLPLHVEAAPQSSAPAR